VAELRRKAALFFASNFDVILLPTFETKQMADRAKWRISSGQTCSMLTFSHFKFKRIMNEA
jgi:putative transposase